MVSMMAAESDEIASVNGVNNNENNINQNNGNTSSNENNNNSNNVASSSSTSSSTLTTNTNDHHQHQQHHLHNHHHHNHNQHNHGGNTGAVSGDTNLNTTGANNGGNIGNIMPMNKTVAAASLNGRRHSNEDVTGGANNLPSNVNNIKHRGAAPSYFNEMPEHHRHSSAILGDDEDDDGLGPLPPKWEKAYTESGEAYFIDHNTGTSHWLDPRLSKFQKKSLEDCLDDELPYGWEKIQDPQYGTYFIDHVNRRTQYENPVLEAKRRVERNRIIPKPNHFTRNPSDLCGERVTTTLLKSSRGLGFTIVGGDDNVDEFLQIKSIVPNGPAWLDGNLQMGDVLVYVNDTCVLGFTHHEMVNVFQSILPGETVTLEVCRGYPLPFDPNDPNTEVVTTIAVDGLNIDPEKTRILMDLNMDGNYNFLDMSDPTSPGVAGVLQKNPLAKIQSGGNRSDDNDSYFNDSNKIVTEKPEILSISIIKGATGFGFTIADSAYGQKVKKILDRQCCKNLQEGDILLAINSIGVKLMSHGEVVQVLKDCPKSQEAVLKVQRGHYYSNANANNKSGMKLRKSIETLRYGGNVNKDGITSSGLYRSKTPTADLYSTQPKEILPTRPKTPLVDTRSRAKTPSTEINNDETDSVTNNNLDKNDETKGAMSDSKSNNSFPDHDSINNDIPYMDPFPKMVSALTDRLAEASLSHDHHNNVYDKYHPDRLHSTNKTFASSQSDLNYDHQMNSDFYNNYNPGYVNTSAPAYGLYSAPPPPLPIMAPIPTYHQDSCFCYECQDYNRQQQEYNMLQHQYHYSAAQLNGRASKKINDYLLDRRKAGFSPLESHNVMALHQPPLWKYGQPSPGSGGLIQPVMQEEYSLSEVTLERQTLGFGFRIVGGTEEGSQVTVGHIVPGGSADHDPRITTGDEILSIDGVNVVNASHHRVVQLMGEAALRGQVTMILRRKTMKHPQNIRYPYDVIVSRNENEGFGFVIISSSSHYYGSTIGKLIPGSPADRCGELKVGDRIIAVNRIDIAGLSHGDVVNLIKESGLHVRLTIGSPRDPNLLITSPQQQQQQHQLQQQSQQQQTQQTVPNTTKNENYFDRYPLSTHPQL